MEVQFNFHLRHRNDKRKWEEIEVYYQTHCDRTTTISYARRLSKTFHSEVRLTEGKEPFKTSGTYIYEQNVLLKIRNYGKMV